VLKRSSKSKGGQYPTAFKIKAIKRVERGEGVLPVARDLGVTRKALHDWVRAWKAHGPEGLNRKRGPKPGRKKLRLGVLDRPQERRNTDKDRIAELERVIGRQQLELDFFRQALRALDGTAAQGKQHGKPGRVSSRSSKT
jgi:transposase-like protein